jgi:prepilin-type processing-associated H-X9-DG protein
MMALQFERLVDLQLVAMQAKGGTEGNSSPLDMLWLKSSEKSEKPQALISAEAPESLAMLSPTENAVVYVTRGVAMVRTFVPVPKEMFIQAATSADKTKAISDAKQAALAAIMFASDNDDEMPKPGDTEKLYPYLKNREILNRFVYTYQGGNLGELKDPAGTEIGYVEGPGGRAIAYADGHVKWKNN